MRHVESREPDAPRVEFVAHRPARVRVMGGPGCAEDADIEYALRAVLWLVGAGDDPRARAQWRGWAERNQPGSLRWGSSGPLTAPLGEALKVG